MLIRTYADIANLKGNAALSPAEKKLIENCKRGELTTLGNGTRPKRSSKARIIRADLLRYLILGGCQECRLHEKGVQLVGAWIAGPLDLSFASAKGAVHLLDCAFEAPLEAYQASFDRLVLNGSSLLGLNAQGAAIKGDVFIRELESTGEVSFSGAEIGGQLLGNGAELNGGDSKALNAQGATIRGGVFFNNLKSTGEVSISGAEIGGQLSGNGAELNGGQGKALNAQGATVTGGAFLRKLKSAGEVSFGGAQIGVQLALEEAVLNGREGTALNAEGAKIKGNAVLDKVKSTGKLSFSGAEIRGRLSAIEAELNGMSGTAMNAQGAKIGDSVFLDKLKSRGEIVFSGADISRRISAKHADLNYKQGKALDANSASIGGSVNISDAKSSGELSFFNADIGGHLSAQRSELKSGKGKALNAAGMRVRGNVILRNVTSLGEISFAGSKIGGQLSFAGAELQGGKGKALYAQRAIVAEGFIWRGLKASAGIVDLTAARFSDLVDDEQSWHPDLTVRLFGLTYENLVGPLNLTFRRRWLKRGAQFKKQFHPQPYQQLAKFYRDTGHRYEAREILVAQEVEQREAMRKAIREGKARSESWLIPGALVFLNHLWDWAMRFIAGYGYKPLRSLAWIAGLVAVMMVAAQLTWDAGDFAPNSAVVLTSPDWKAIADGPSQNPAADWSDIHAPGKDYETFYSFAYALDVVVPVLDLGQTDAWAPSPARGDAGKRLFYAQKMFIVAGWVVTAIAAAAISGMIRRDD